MCVEMSLTSLKAFGQMPSNSTAPADCGVSSSRTSGRQNTANFNGQERPSWVSTRSVGMLPRIALAQLVSKVSVSRLEAGNGLRSRIQGVRPSSTWAFHYDLEPHKYHNGLTQ